MMRSTYATTAEALGPETVRLLAVQKNLLGATMIVNAAYALLLEQQAVDGALQSALSLTHVRTGSYWNIAPREGRKWIDILYADDTEFAALDARIVAPVSTTDGGILRRSVASLGKPMPPKWTP